MLRRPGRSLFIFVLLIVALMAAACGGAGPGAKLPDVNNGGSNGGGGNGGGGNGGGPVQGKCTKDERCVINTIEQLQAIGGHLYGHLLDIDEPLKGHYILGQNIDASATKHWNDGDGFLPLGNQWKQFEGSLDGNGKKIEGLHTSWWMGRGDGVGLFGTTGELAEIYNLRLVDVNVGGGPGYGRLGSLVGINKGKITDVSVAGTITQVRRSGDGGTPYIGGLVGLNEGTIEHASTDVTLTSDSAAGGLVGHNSGRGTISGSNSTAQVYGDTVGPLGGLVALNEGLIERSHTLSGGKVISTRADEGWTSDVGGLVGDNRGRIKSSTAAATVEGYENVGGLVGGNRDAGTIEDSASSGSATGYNQRIGGLVGFNSGTGASVARSYSTGTVYGKRSNIPDRAGRPVTDIGGLVGWNVEGAEIIDSYSHASFGGDADMNDVGGLVGTNGWGWGVGSIKTSYSIGSPPVGGTNVGGLVGENGGGSVDGESFWDTEHSGISTSAAGTGKTTDEMHDPATFKEWDEFVWNIQSGQYPLLWDAPRPDGS